MAGVAVQLALNAAVVGVLLYLAALGLTARVRADAASQYRWWCGVFLVMLLMPGWYLLRMQPRASAETFAPVITESRPIVVRSDVGTELRAEATELVAEDMGPAALTRPPVRPALRLSAPGQRFLLQLYGVAAATLLVMVGASWLRLRSMVRSTQRLAPPAEQDAIAVAARCGVHRRVRFRTSGAMMVPATVGFLRPTVLLPHTLWSELDGDQRAHVIAHELAHVHRWDDWALLVERMVAAVLCFQPGIHAVRRRLELAREAACDQFVLDNMGVSPERYAETLVSVARWSLRRPQPAGALSMATRLRHRVDALLAAQPGTRSPRVFAARAGFVVVAILLARAPLLQVHARPTPTSEGADAGDALAGTAASSPGARVDALLRDFESFGFHGAALVMRGDQVLLRKGFGLADRRAGVPWTPETTFNAGAVAKMLTAAAILRLEEQGRLRIADRVDRYLGPFPGIKSAVTIHHLLTHSDGLTRVWAPVQRDTRDAFVQAVKDAPADAPAGQGERYGDIGHALLAAVIEVASGMRYEDYVRAELLSPAGMNHTRFEDEALDPNAMLAVEYSESAGFSSAVGSRPYRWGRRGSMGVRTTLDDLLRWHRSLAAGRILSSASLERMWTGYRSEGRKTLLGYGWEIGPSSRGTRVRHRLTAWPGNSVEIAYDLDEDLFVVLVANSGTNWTRPKYEEILRAAVGRPHFAPPAAAPASIAVAAGTFIGPQGDTLTIQPDRDHTFLVRRTHHGSSRPATVRAARAVADDAIATVDWTSRSTFTFRFSADGRHLTTGRDSTRWTRISTD